MKKTWLTPWRQRATAIWQRQSPREQRALRLLGWALLLALGAQALWSLEQARREQLRLLPRLTADAARVTALAQEWRHLADSTAPPDTASIERAVTPRVGELGPGIAARWNGGGQLHLTGTVNFPSWLRWTATMQQEYRLSIDSARIVGSAEQVRIDALYRSSGAPQ